MQYAPLVFHLSHGQPSLYQRVCFTFYIGTWRGNQARSHCGGKSSGKAFWLPATCRHKKHRNDFRGFNIAWTSLPPLDLASNVINGIERVRAGENEISKLLIHEP